MTRNRIDKKTLKEQLPAILEEQLRRDGLSRREPPSWKYITANTPYSAEGLNNKCEELFGQTLHEFLKEQGFRSGPSGRWPTDDEATVQSLVYFFNSLERGRGLADSTIDAVETTINQIYKAIDAENLGIEILEVSRYSTEEERITNIQHTKTIIERLDDELADGTMENYTRYFSDYYDIVENRFVVDHNPVVQALSEFDFKRSAGDPHPVTAENIQRLWDALNALEDCPVQGYNLDEWRLWMKMLLVFLIAVGPRSSEVEQLDVRHQLHFGDDPHVLYENRKNLRSDEGPVRVPIMFGADLLEAYVGYIEAVDENGKLIPSPDSESGSRTPATLNNWVEVLSKEAGVRLDNGDIPTLQNFRQFWKARYKQAVHKNREHIRFVSEEGKTKTPTVDEENYIPDADHQQYIRELGRRHFEAVLDIDEFPELIQEETREHTTRQGYLTDFK
jgi:integrase